MDSRTKEALKKRADQPYYRIMRFTGQGEDETDPWVVWDSAGPSGTEPNCQEAKLVERLDKRDSFSWRPFVDAGDGELFIPCRFYEQERESGVDSVIDGLSEELAMQDGIVHATEVGKLKALRDEARLELDRHAEMLEEQVMEPLRRVLIPCLVESFRNLVGFENGLDPDQDPLSVDKWRRWKRTRRRIIRLWSRQIGSGVPWEKLQEQLQHNEAFKHVPVALAEGAKLAIEFHVPKDGVANHTRDAILGKAKPAYYRWVASQQMIKSALYEQKIREPVSREADRYRRRIEGVLPALDPESTVREMCNITGEPATGNTVRREIKINLKKHQDFEGRLTAERFCELVRKEAKRLGIGVE